MNGVMRQVPCSSLLFLVNKGWFRLSGMSANLSSGFLSAVCALTHGPYKVSWLGFHTCGQLAPSA